MKTIILGLAVLALVVFGDEMKKDDKDLNELFVGTYSFEIMGRPHRLYLCGSEDDKSVYWAVSDRAEEDSEYTVALGRDDNGVEHLKDEHTYVLRCDIFRLYGEEHLQGFYEFRFDYKKLQYTLRERFPQFEDGESGSNQLELWNTYELSKMSPEIVGNPDVGGYQCFHPLNNVIYQLPLPSKWTSDFIEGHHGYYSALIEENAYTQCWKLENEFGNVVRAGWMYDFEFQWDGSLLLAKFDSELAEKHCTVGSQFLVVLDKDLALVSYQCEDRVTGRQFLVHLNEHMMKDELCPYKTDEFAVKAGYPKMEEVVGHLHRGGNGHASEK